MTRPASARWDSETMLVAWLAGCASLVSFLFYLRQGDLLLYGDAVAHINIARRVFDSRTPGLLQLGTVWLPLPHLLMIPFLLSDWLWHTGIGGSIPSLIAYVFGTIGIFRLVRGGLDQGEDGSSAKPAAWMAAVIFAANPNLIYLQATAMTESLYLAFFIWALVHFSEFAEQQIVPAKAKSSIWKCAACLAAACLIRYDGWFLAAAISAAVIVFVISARRERRTLYRATAVFVSLVAAAPALWLAYNAAVYRNPLEFANGPYSAKAIEQKTSAPGAPPHPGAGNLVAAAGYFIKAGELTMMEGNWHRLWLMLAVLGTAAIIFHRRAWFFLLLWTPLPFYALSIAHGGVPIFIPPWWPYTLYNARYGVELLPAFAVFATAAFYFAGKLVSSTKAKFTLSAALLLFVAVSYATILRAQPVAFREAWTNSRTRVAIERELASTLTKLPNNSTLLMYLGDHPGALEQAGIPLRRLIYEGNHRTWKQPADPEGLWERALKNPSQFADYVIASDGDAVALAVTRQHLTSLAVIHVTGQPRIVLYSTGRSIPSQ
jgi:hypothetical protein